MEIVKTVQEIPKLASKQSQDISITKLSNEFDEEVTHLFEKLGIFAT